MPHVSNFYVNFPYTFFYLIQNDILVFLCSWFVHLNSLLFIFWRITIMRWGDDSFLISGCCVIVVVVVSVDTVCTSEVLHQGIKNARQKQTFWGNRRRVKDRTVTPQTPFALCCSWPLSSLFFQRHSTSLLHLFHILCSKFVMQQSISYEILL